MKAIKLSPGVFILVLMMSSCYAQDSIVKSREREKRLSLGIQSGATVHADYMARRSFSQNGFGVNYFEFLISYKIFDDLEAGVSIGQDEFTYQSPSVMRAITFFPPDTTYDTVTFTGLSTHNWGALNINYFFNKNIFTGIKGGFDPRFNAVFLGANFGTQLLESDEWGLNTFIQFMTRFDPNEYRINSYQVNLLFNVRYKIDISGILEDL